MQANWEHRLIELAGNAPKPAASPFFSYWAGDLALQKAYARCAAITAQHSKSFYLASGFLPEEKRAAVRALYAFCRTVDDIVDGSSEAGRDLALDYWRAQVHAESAPADDQVAAAWSDTLLRYHIPRHYALQLIDGVARDLSEAHYSNFEELSTYCYGVASTVGLMSMYIVGFESSEAVPYAIKLGVALQMTNILRDVGEDFRNGRVYLPQDEMHAFGIRASDLQLGGVTDQWREFMRFQIERTRKLYADAWPGIKMLDRDGRLAIAAAARLYSGILDVIERNDYDVFARRASLSAWGKMGRIAPLLWTL
ncbi:MAG: phytoene/squalene synthase family protein [Anaerolineales bacterium]